MDQADAQRSYATSTDYEMKAKRRQIVVENITCPEAKRLKIMSGIDHDKTKEQQKMLSKQLIVGIERWESAAQALLSEANHGIPTLTEIGRTGRRQQDKENLETQLEAERARTANLTRAVITIEMIESEAKGTDLSNDRVLRLGEERLALRAKLTEMSIKKYWDKMKVPSGKMPGKWIIRQAWRSFPKLHKIVYRSDKASPVRTKGEALKLLGSYLSKTKYLAKNICEFMYGIRGKDNAVAKRDRLIEQVDILEKLKYFRVIVEEESDEISMSAARRAVSSFGRVDSHYGYALNNSSGDNNENDKDDEVNDSDSDTDEIGEEVDGNAPRFISIG